MPLAGIFCGGFWKILLFQYPFGLPSTDASLHEPNFSWTEQDKFTQVTFQHKQNLQQIIGSAFSLKATGADQLFDEKNVKKGKMEKIRLCKPALISPTRKIKPGKPARMAEHSSIANVLAVDWSQLSYNPNE